MFGFGKEKTHHVKLTEKQIRELKKNMSKKELKEFEKRQREAEEEIFWDAVLLSEIFRDD